eukprot:7665882-Ditylum_brightwellii.AAC.1
MDKQYNKQILTWKKEGKIILMTDINSSIGDEDIGEFIGKTGLIDLIGIQHGIPQINSHITGGQQINFILGTEQVAQAVVQGGECHDHEIGQKGKAK